MNGLFNITVCANYVACNTERTLTLLNLMTLCLKRKDTFTVELWSEL